MVVLFLPLIGDLTGDKMQKETIGDCTLYLGDNQVILPQLQDFDLILTDPPYGIDEANGKNKNRGSAPGLKKWNGSRNTTGTGVASTDFGASNWDKEPPPDWFMKLMLSKSAHQIIFGGNYFNLPPSRCFLVWDKNNGTTDFADCELAWTNLDKAVRMIKHTWNGMLQQNMKQKEKRVHETQKPLPVIDWALSHAPKNTKTVCDPFVGSGTTGVICAKHGLEFTGIEREEKHFNTACERITEAYRTRPRLFDTVKPVAPVQENLF